jgi:hypothetical protein
MPEGGGLALRIGDRRIGLEPLGAAVRRDEGNPLTGERNAGLGLDLHHHRVRQRLADGTGLTVAIDNRQLEPGGGRVGERQIAPAAHEAERQDGGGRAKRDCKAFHAHHLRMFGSGVP